MTYDGGIRVAKYEDYKLPWSAPWALGACAEGIVPDVAVIELDHLYRLWMGIAQYILAGRKEEEE